MEREKKNVKNETWEQTVKKMENISDVQEDYARRQCRMSQITALASVLTLLVVLLTCTVAMLRLNALFYDTQALIEDVNLITSRFSDVDMIKLCSDLDHLIDDSQKSITEALFKINSIDIGSLNTAIKNLSDLLAPLSRLLLG